MQFTFYEQGTDSHPVGIAFSVPLQPAETFQVVGLLGPAARHCHGGGHPRRIPGGGQGGGQSKNQSDCGAGQQEHTLAAAVFLFITLQGAVGLLDTAGSGVAEHYGDYSITNETAGLSLGFSKISGGRLEKARSQ